MNNQVTPVAGAQFEALEANQPALPQNGIVNGMIIHELANAVGAVSGAVDLLRMSEPHSSTYELAMLRLRGGAQAMTAMIRSWQVLFDETVTPPLFTEEDLPSFVQEIATDPVFAGADAVGRVRLTTRCRNGRLAFCPVLLRHALGNLVRNALRYSPRTSTVELVIGGRGDRRWIHVLNRGPRIPDAIAARLFEPGKKHPQGGMGFGLHVARTCMERMGGSVAFGSTRRATVFSLLLPCSSTAPAAAPARTSVADEGVVNRDSAPVPEAPVPRRASIAPQRFVAAPLIDFPRPIPAG